MTRRPLLIDLFCNAGGASEGYRRAGFDVVGVDNVAQPHYPFPLHVGDALAVLRDLLHGRPVLFDGAAGELLVTFDGVAAYAASPPCQAFTLAQRIQGREHPDLIGPVRELLAATGRPYVIENVPGAPLRDPVELCGAMFPGLRVYRHRLFESNVPLTVPQFPAGTLGGRLAEGCGWPHPYRLTKMGRPPRPGEFMHVVGNFSGAAAARAAMGISWGVRDTLREAVPPAYTEHLGRQLMAALAAADVAA